MAQRRQTIHTPEGNIERVVFDVGYMGLCDGYQYARVHHKGECTVRRLRGEGDLYGDWELMPEPGTIQDISKEGLLEICMSFARRIHGENPSDEECEELINKEWALLR